MKVIVFKRMKWMIFLSICFCLATLIFITILGYFFNWKYISIFTDITESNKYEVRSQLLMEAMEQVGVCCPEDAAKVWANGLEMRSAALQYSVMDKELKKEYAKQLETSAPNWVTGISSPWVDSYKIVSTEVLDKDRYIIRLRFSLATSTGPAGEYNAILTAKNEDGFWRIVQVSADPQLYPYTRFISEGI